MPVIMPVTARLTALGPGLGAHKGAAVMNRPAPGPRRHQPAPRPRCSRVPARRGQRPSRQPNASQTPELARTHRRQRRGARRRCSFFLSEKPCLAQGRHGRSLGLSASPSPCQAPAASRTQGCARVPRCAPAEPGTAPFRATGQRLHGLEQSAWALGPQFTCVAGANSADIRVSQQT